MGIPVMAQTLPSSDAAVELAPQDRSPTRLDVKPDRKTENTADNQRQDGNDSQLQKVEVVGRNSDTEQRRAASASRIVVGKEEIERFGDSSASEVLKRLPGITVGGRPGRGGDIRMRGMGGGYTQILLNGERMPPGYSLDNLPPDQIERIEIMRAPTAEFGARAIAGTINIVLKEALKISANALRLGVGVEGDSASPSVSWTRNDKFAESIPYTFTVSASQSKSQDDTQSQTVWTDLTADSIELDQHTSTSSVSTRQGLNINGRIQIPLAQGESLALMPLAIVSRRSNDSSGQLEQAPGGSVPQPYATTASTGNGNFGLLRGNLEWQKRLSEATRLELRMNAGSSQFDSDGLQQDFDNSQQPIRITKDVSSTRETSWGLNGKASHQLASENSVVAGLEYDQTRRDQTRTTVQNGALLLTDFGDSLAASSQRVASYVQDEWNPSPAVSAYVGLRWEAISTSSSGANYALDNTSNVLTPLLHLTWKPDEKSRNQWRTSLTRSYKAASLQDLMARPSISQRYPTGANPISSPDQAGNPALRPELASGFEVAYEHYLAKGGLISVNFFYRRIENLIRNVVGLENVSWSDQARWVSRPQNVGNATAKGLELEAKVRLDEVLPDAWPVALRSNLSFFDSQVDQVPGPNNRLEGQPKGTANLGLDYKLRAMPLSFGANLNITPSYDLQVSSTQSTTTGNKVVADAFVLWAINPAAQLRLNFNNVVPRDYLSTSTSLTDTQLQLTTSNNPSVLNWGVRLELKL